MRIFAYDSPVWRFMGRLVDFMCLTLLFVITSLPIITIGTSITTVYYITLKMTENQEGYLFSTYFKTFRMLWKETMINSIAVLAIGVILGGDIWICYTHKNELTTMLFAFLVVLAVIYVAIVTYFYPVMARTNNTFVGYLKASFYLAIRYFSWTLLLMVIQVCVLAIGIFAFWPLLLISVGLIAYLQSLVFKEIFRQQDWQLEG